MRTLTVATILSLALPAAAHDRDGIEAFEADWSDRVVDAGALSISLLDERNDFISRHSWFYNPSPAPVSPANPTATTRAGVHRGMGDGVEQWRGLVAAYFGGETDYALRIMACESGGNANALNPSSASGLFQVKTFWFDVYGGNPFDPENNVRVAKLVRDNQGWGAWTCSRKI